MNQERQRYLFVGPTLPDAVELSAGRNVRVLPPVAGGDLLDLPLRPGDVIGIVDGYFHQTLAVRHKEILAAIDKGAHVLGAASIGALRAAELDTFGMVGVGQIYQDYRDGTLTADDAVALSHSTADTGYRPLSEPLVNIRATLRQAESAGLLDTAMRWALVDALAAMPYPQRTYPRLARLAHHAGLAEPAIDALTRFCAEHPVNVKRADALRLLDAVSEGAPERCPVPDISRTSFLHTWEFRAARTVTADGTASVSDFATLRACQLFDPGYPARYRAMVLDQLARECTDHCGLPNRGDTAERAVAHGVHRGIYPPVDAAAELGFLRHWLTPAERNTLPPHERLVTFLVRSFRVSPGIVDDRGALAALRATHDLEPARALVRAANDMNEQVGREYPDFDVAALDPDRITAWFAERWAATPEDLPLRALDRGLESVAALVGSARGFFLLAKYNPAHVDLRLTAN